MQIIDLCVAITLFIISCLVGAYVMHRYDTWLSFNGPALLVLAAGELSWWQVKKQLVERWNSNKPE